MPHAPFRPSIDACNACALACDHCAASCLNEKECRKMAAAHPGASRSGAAARPRAH